eukprot:scaffold101405_cov27-Phaeocystis_antarctica.AAC.1
MRVQGGVRVCVGEAAKAVHGGARAARTDERGVGGGGGVEERRGEGIVERGEDLVRVRVRVRGR